MDEFLKLAATIMAIVGARLWSRWEHHKGQKQQVKDILEIKLSLNGELERRLEEAREQGRQEERNKKQSS